MSTRRGMLMGLWAAVTAGCAKAFMPVRQRSVTYRFTEVRRGEVRPGEYYFQLATPLPDKELQEVEEMCIPWRWWNDHNKAMKSPGVIAYRREVIR